MAAFTQLGIMPELAGPLEEMDWLLPTEIQSEAIPLILGGGDVLMASETGTGKTGAFCLPLLQVVHEQLSDPKKQEEKPDSSGHAKNPNKKWTLSIQDRAPDVVLGSDLLTIQSKSGNWQGCRSVKGIKRPKNSNRQFQRLYYEVHFAERGLARVGWSFSDASFDLGTDRSGFGYGGTAKKSNNKQFTDYGHPFGEKFDIVGCVFDINTGELSFTKNGRSMGLAFKIPVKTLESRELYPSICVKNAGCQVRFESNPDINDHKPKDCIWISEANEDLIVDRACASANKSREDSPLAIILEPTRELAKQTYDCLERFSRSLKIKNALWIGGGDERSNEKTVHIIVSTPGRIQAAMRSDIISLDNIHFLILDEADSLIQQGHRNLICQLYNRLPKMFTTGRRLQIICCSATLHNLEVQKLAKQLMYFPMWIDLKGEDSVPDTVHHVILRINPMEDHIYRDLDGLFETDGVHDNDDVKQTLFNSNRPLKRPEELSEALKLMKFYYALKAIESLKMDQGIIFCRTRLDCDNLYTFMQDMNEKTNLDRYSCERLHSSLSQQERERNLVNFKSKRFRFLLCTDVAARGIDVKGMPFVIQITLPDEQANYVHRIGRVGRADRMGLALSLVGEIPEKVWYHQCNKRSCHNTRLIDRGGCCKWIDELEMLSDIEDHLKCSIQEIDKDFKLQVDEYDGKVVYGAKRLSRTTTYEGHVEQLKSIVRDLSDLESKAQDDFIRLYM